MTYAVWAKMAKVRPRLRLKSARTILSEPTTVEDEVEPETDTRTPDQIEQDAIAACSIEHGEDCEACGS